MQPYLNMNLSGLTEIESLNFLMGECQGVPSRIANLASKYDYSNPVGFSRNGVFYDFSLLCSKTLIKKVTNLESLNAKMGCCQVTLRTWKSWVSL